MGQTINRSQIETEELVCPYCMNQVSYSKHGCCGESSCHFETAYIVGDEAILKSEVSEIIEDLCLSCENAPKGDSQLCLKCERYKPGDS